MSTTRHTPVSAGASATAATINAPLGQLDAALNPTVVSFVAGSDATTTVTTAGTYYATAAEVAFTPAFTGQVFDIRLALGRVYASAAGTITYNLRITDGASATLNDFWLATSQQAVSTALGAFGGSRTYTAVVGDVGQTRKAKLYVTHTVNGTVAHQAYLSLEAVSH